MQKKIYTKPENITYAQQFLLDITERKQLRLFWRKYLEGKGFNFFYLWNVMTGKMPPSLGFIWALRFGVNPLYWFYTVYEKKPKNIPIKKNPEAYDYYKTLNFCYLENLDNLYLFCKHNELSYNTMWLLKNRKRKITYEKIKQLKTVLPVENWFIY